MRPPVRKRGTGRVAAVTAIVPHESLHGDRFRRRGHGWACSCSCLLMRARMLAWTWRPVPSPGGWRGRGLPSVCAASGKAVGVAGAKPAGMMVSAWSARVRSRKHRLCCSAILPCQRLGPCLCLRLPAFGRVAASPGWCCLLVRASWPACLGWSRQPASGCVPARAGRPLRRRAP